MIKNKKNIAVFATGFAIMLFSGVFYAWSLFRVTLQNQFPSWSGSEVSLNLSLFIVTFCLGSLLSGRLTARLGQPNVARIGAAVVLAGGCVFLLLERQEASAALITLYLSYGGLCGFGTGMIYNADLSAVNGCFPNSGGLISGALLTGFGFGSLVMGAAVTALADVIGFYPAFFISVLLVASTAFFGAPVLCVTDRSAAVAVSGSDKDMTTKQMLASPVFWMFFLWVLFMTSGALMVINSSASIAMTFGAAAIVGMIVSVFNGLSRTFIGALCDRKGSGAAMAAANIIAAFAGVFLLGAYAANSTCLMVGGLIAAGISYGCAMSMNAAVTREKFGVRHYPSNLSVVTLSGIPASVVGPYTAGLLQDASGGDYKTTFIAMLIFSAIAALLLAGICLKGRNR